MDLGAGGPAFTAPLRVAAKSSRKQALARSVHQATPMQSGFSGDFSTSSMFPTQEAKYFPANAEIGWQMKLFRASKLIFAVGGTAGA
jgi:hypothetical protein